MINEFDIVRVVKKTRAKFKDMSKAEPGKCYLVTSTYTPSATQSRYGYTAVTKAFLLDEENKSSFTTQPRSKKEFFDSTHRGSWHDKTAWRGR